MKANDTGSEHASTHKRNLSISELYSPPAERPRLTAEMQVDHFSARRSFEKQPARRPSLSSREPARRPLPPSSSASQLSPPPSFGESSCPPSPPPSFRESGYRPSSYGEKYRPSACTFGICNDDASCLTATRSFSEVKHASLELVAQRRMIFHHLRLSAALKAFQTDTRINHQQWWMQNLKFELDNALTFVGFCTTQDRNIPVPNLICLLAHAFSSKAYSYLLSTSQIWEECYSSDELISLTNRLHSAWWAHPGSGKGFFTDDELNKAFEQYLILVPPSRVDIERLGDQRTGRRCRRGLHAQEPIASVFASIEAAKTESPKRHRPTLYAPALLSKVDRENRQAT